MSEENVLIPRARYEKMLERLAKYEGGLKGGDEKSDIAEGKRNDDIDNNDDDEPGGRTMEDIIAQSESLEPPGIKVSDLDFVF
jgi:hypothetical protein